MKILLIDDHQLFLEGLSLLLEARLKNTQVICANNANDAFKVLKKQKFDLCITDFYMPDTSGLSIIKQLSKDYPGLPTMLVSSSENVQDIADSLEAGTKGFLNKSANGDKIVAAVQTVLTGGISLPSSVQEELDNLDENEHQLRLTQKQYETLRLLTKGLSNRAIAEKMGIKEVTIKTHVSDLLNAFQVKNRTECVLRAKQLGIVS